MGTPGIEYLGCGLEPQAIYTRWIILCSLLHKENGDKGETNWGIQKKFIKKNYFEQRTVCFLNGEPGQIATSLAASATMLEFVLGIGTFQSSPS